MILKSSNKVVTKEEALKNIAAGITVHDTETSPVRYVVLSENELTFIIDFYEGASVGVERRQWKTPNVLTLSALDLTLQVLAPAIFLKVRTSAAGVYADRWFLEKDPEHGTTFKGLVSMGEEPLIFSFTGGEMHLESDDTSVLDLPEAPEKHTPVNPSHYKSYIGELQWIEAMGYIPTLRDPKVYIGALELQIRKYLDRNGGKDASVQEIGKATVYMVYLLMYMKGGNKVPKMEDVQKILSEVDKYV